MNNIENGSVDDEIVLNMEACFTTFDKDRSVQESFWRIEKRKNESFKLWNSISCLSSSCFVENRFVDTETEYLFICLLFFVPHTQTHIHSHLCKLLFRMCKYSLRVYLNLDYNVWILIDFSFILVTAYYHQMNLHCYAKPYSGMLKVITISFRLNNYVKCLRHLTKIKMNSLIVMNSNFAGNIG